MQYKTDPTIVKQALIHSWPVDPFPDVNRSTQDTGMTISVLYQYYCFQLDNRLYIFTLPNCAGTQDLDPYIIDPLATVAKIISMFLPQPYRCRQSVDYDRAPQ
jgi:hypothetical protein